MECYVDVQQNEKNMQKLLNNDFSHPLQVASVIIAGIFAVTYAVETLAMIFSYALIQKRSKALKNDAKILAEIEDLLENVEVNDEIIFEEGAEDKDEDSENE